MMQPVTQLSVKNSSLKLRLQAPQLTSDSDTITAQASQKGTRITWDGRAGDVLLHGECQESGAGLWHLDFTLENNGPAAEVRLALPYLFYHFDQDQPARMFNPLFGGVLEPSAIPLRISYPGPASFCLTAAAGLDSTVVVGLYNHEQRHTVIRHIPAGVDGQIRFVFERVWVKAGETVTLPRMFIAVGADWAEAMRPYRNWFRTAFPRKRGRPGWWEQGTFSETRHAHCLVPFNPPEAAAGVWIFDNEGRPRTFEQVKAEIDEIVQQGHAKGFQPLFYQFGWWQNMAELQGLFMFDSLCGDYTQAHALVRQAVEYIHQQGGRTYFYINAISAGDETKVYRRQPELFARDGRGFAIYNMEYPMLMFCPGAPGMRAYWERILQYLLVDLGVDGLFLDQVCGGAPPPYCYDPAHKHAHPDTYGQDFLELIDFIVERARQLNPDAYVGGELIQDSRGVLLDEAHGYGYTGPRSKAPQSLEERLNSHPPEYFVFSRYLCPEIYSSHGGSALALMNGAAGHHADPFWREHRRVLESECIPCRVEPRGVLAYLYGPKDGRAILVVRAAVEFDRVRVFLPAEVETSLPARLAWDESGAIVCPAAEQPAFYVLTVEEKGS